MYALRCRDLTTLAALVASLSSVGCERPESSEVAPTPQSAESPPRAGRAAPFAGMRLPDFRLDVRFSAHDRATPRAEACVLPEAGTPVGLVASEAGLVVAWTSDTGPDLRVQRMSGRGCALAPEGRAVAATELLDADDLGRLYVFPAEATEPGVLSTMLPQEYPGSMVARVDASGRVLKLLPAGRGIWGFGVSPGGDALWVTACGPTGIFAVSDEVGADVLPPPATSWQDGSVLTGPETLFSIGYQTCAWDAPLSEDCGLALVRTTPAGSTELGTTVADFGAGPERATLARCGDRVCGVYSAGLRIWDESGAVVDTLDRATLGLSADEHVVMASGNGAGVYVLAQGDRSSRVSFVAR